MKTYAIKYLELAEKHAEKMANKWVKDVQNNAKTPTYKDLDKQKITLQCVRFYQNFSKMFLDEKITDDVLRYFRSYAQESYIMGIPAKETIYALILMDGISGYMQSSRQYSAQVLINGKPLILSGGQFYYSIMQPMR